MVDVTRQQQVRPPIEHHAQLTARGGDIIAAKRVVQMFEVADETVPDATFERDRPHQSVAFQRPAHPRVRAKLSEVAGGDMGGRLEVIGGRPGNEVHRPADGVPPIQRALRPSKHFDAIQIEKPRERHRGPSEVHAVEIDRRTRIRSGKHGVCPDPTDRELAPAGVLRKRHRGRQRRRFFDGLGSETAEIGLRDGRDRDGDLLDIATTRPGGRDDRLRHERDSQGEGHRCPFPRPDAHGTLPAARSRSVLRKSRSRLPGRLETRSRPRHRWPPCGPRHPESSRGRPQAGPQSGQRWNRPPLPRTVRPRERPGRRPSARQPAKFSWFDARCISLHGAKPCRVPYSAS